MNKVESIETTALKYYEGNISTKEMNATQKLAMINALISHDSAITSKTTALALEEFNKAEMLKQKESMTSTRGVAISSASALLYGTAGLSATAPTNGVSSKLLGAVMKMDGNNSVSEIAEASTKAAAMFGNFAKVPETIGQIEGNQRQAAQTEYRSNQEQAQAQASDTLQKKGREASKEEENSQMITSLQQQEYQTKRSMVTST